MKVLVTGASGFVGRAVCRALVIRGHEVAGLVRTDARLAALPSGVAGHVFGDIHGTTKWEHALRGADAVVHLAARVHVRGGEANFLDVNASGTRNLAVEAARAGVDRLIFMSSIAVNGPDKDEEELTEHSPAAPANPYARSKWEAERALAAAAKTGLRTLALRPPVVYGAGAPGGFSRLVSWIRCGRPVPVAASGPPRSMIHEDNLAAATADALTWRWDGHAVCLVADRERLSVAELVREIGRRIGRETRIVPIPDALLVAAAALTSSSQLAALCQPLRVSIDGARTRFGWTPPVPLLQALDRAIPPRSGA